MHHKRQMGCFPKEPNQSSTNPTINEEMLLLVVGRYSSYTIKTKINMRMIFTEMAELDASPQTGKSLHFDNIDENDVSVDIPSFQFIKHLHDLSRQVCVYISYLYSTGSID